MDNKFEVGKTYNATTMYGKDIRYSVVKLLDHQVVMKAEWYNNDTGDYNESFNNFEIKIESGIEKILLWEYHNHECWLYANEYI